MANHQTYVALLRGINVGGHHKVPMADFRIEMEEMGFKNVITLLNSGNVIFEGDSIQELKIEEKISIHLERFFGFSIPVLIRKSEEIVELINANPFENIEATKDTRFYVTFLKQPAESQLTLPWISEDQSFRILDIRNRAICSVLDLSVTATPKGMESLEKIFGNDITTRNWNTVNRIAGKLG